MAVKKVSWRRSNQALSLLLLLLVPTYLFSADSGGAAGGKLEALDDSKGEERLFNNYSYGELETTYERAPREVKHLVERLKHPTFMKKPQIRATLFKGEPGTDKTTTAFAVCYKLRELFSYAPINCAEMAREG